MKMAKNPTRIVSIGVGSNHPAFEIARRLATNLAAPFSPFATIPEARSHLRQGGWSTLVLTATLDEKERVWRHVAKLASLSRIVVLRIVVVGHERESHGELALQCIKAGAFDYIPHAMHPGDIEVRIARALDVQVKQAYPRHQAFDDAGTGRTAFIVTPYAPALLKHYHYGIRPALSHAGWNPLLAQDIVDSAPLNEKIRKCIEQSELVIANVTRADGINDNPNVYYEIGFAHGRSCKVIFVCQEPLPDILPTDVRGLELFKFSETIDLALKLYFAVGGTSVCS